MNNNGDSGVVVVVVVASSTRWPLRQRIIKITNRNGSGEEIFGRYGRVINANQIS